MKTQSYGSIEDHNRDKYGMTTLLFLFFYSSPQLIYNLMIDHYDICAWPGYIIEKILKSI